MSARRNISFSRWPVLMKRMATALLVPFLLLCIFEGVLRIVGFSYTPRDKAPYKPVVAMRIGTTTYSMDTVLDPPGYLWSWPKEVRNTPLAKVPGEKRIVFLGGSTTQEDGLRSYPRRCIDLLNKAAPEANYTMYNLGLSSYSTHQSLLALERYGFPAQPDAVVLFHGWNDLLPQRNGYSDRQIDRMLRMQSRFGMRFAKLAPLWRLRLVQALAAGLERLDRGWPHLRVSPDEFEENMVRIAALCAARGVPLVLVERPINRSCTYHPYDELTKRCWPEYGGDTRALYVGLHSTVTQIQHRVAATCPGVRLAPVCTVLDTKQQELVACGEVNLSLFTTDNGHVYGLANQYIAETVARTIAPEWSDRIDELVALPGYWMSLAEEFRTMDAPFQCRYALDRALSGVAQKNELFQELEAWAYREMAFKTLFEKGRWDNGLDLSLKERLDILSQCQNLRPGDYGVVQQIFMACQYLGRPGQAYPYLVRFAPQTPRDEHDGKHLLLQAAWDAEEYETSLRVAQDLINMDPNDPDAREVLRRLVGQPAPSQ